MCSFLSLFEKSIQLFFLPFFSRFFILVVFLFILKLFLLLLLLLAVVIDLFFVYSSSPWIIASMQSSILVIHFLLFFCFIAYIILSCSMVYMNVLLLSIWRRVQSILQGRLHRLFIPLMRFLLRSLVSRSFLVLPLILYCSNPLSNLLGLVSSAPTTIGINVICIFHSFFFSSLARSKYLSNFSFSFIFIQ